MSNIHENMSMVLPLSDLGSDNDLDGAGDTAADMSEFAEIEKMDGSVREIAVDFVETEQICIPEIRDVHGRLSDVLEALEEQTGFSVIPLKAARISSEVVQLSRHEIFCFNGERYAFSHKIRQDVLDRYTQIVVDNMSTGLPFSLSLMTNFQYDNQLYRTLLLSRDEWTLLLSKFRAYKHSLVVHNENDIVLGITTEKA